MTGGGRCCTKRVLLLCTGPDAAGVPRRTAGAGAASFGYQEAGAAGGHGHRHTGLHGHSIAICHRLV